MNVVLAIVIGGLYSAGLYLMMRRNIVKLIIGLALIGHAANLLIFTAGGLTRAQPPVIGETARRASMSEIADPLPQALILTAIVIGFGVTAFLLVLAHRAYQTVGAEDLDDLNVTDT